MGDTLITIGATLTLWVSLPIVFVLGIRECLKKEEGVILLIYRQPMTTHDK